MHYFRNYSFAHFEANFPEKPCSRIGQILHFKMVVWALWVRCGVFGESQWVSEGNSTVLWLMAACDARSRPHK